AAMATRSGRPNKAPSSTSTPTSCTARPSARVGVHCGTTVGAPAAGGSTAASLGRKFSVPIGWHRTAGRGGYILEQRGDDVRRGNSTQPHLRAQGHPVRQGRDGYLLHVLGNHVVPPSHRGRRSGQQQEGKRTARRRPNEHLWVAAGRDGQL